MTIKEKVKAYDEAIGRAKAVLNDGTISSCNLAYLQDIFPELEELKNEIIRKHLIAFFKNTCSKESYARFAGIKIAEIIAWLEKQGNPININSSEFDLRLNKLLKQFKTLPKEELANSLSFYLNVVQNENKNNYSLSDLKNSIKRMIEFNILDSKELYEYENEVLKRVLKMIDKVNCI